MCWLDRLVGLDLLNMLNRLNRLNILNELTIICILNVFQIFLSYPKYWEQYILFPVPNPNDWNDIWVFPLPFQTVEMHVGLSRSCPILRECHTTFPIPFPNCKKWCWSCQINIYDYFVGKGHTGRVAAKLLNISNYKIKCKMEETASITV